tara:strand:- start:377 stop:532 length:156 start_codon:yes stop_codon:yes gene_type:complete
VELANLLLELAALELQVLLLVHQFKDVAAAAAELRKALQAAVALVAAAVLA